MSGRSWRVAPWRPKPWSPSRIGHKLADGFWPAEIADLQGLHDRGRDPGRELQLDRRAEADARDVRVPLDEPGRDHLARQVQPLRLRAGERLHVGPDRRHPPL